MIRLGGVGAISVVVKIEPRKNQEPSSADEIGMLALPAKPRLHGERLFHDGAVSTKTFTSSPVRAQSCRPVPYLPLIMS